MYIYNVVIPLLLPSYLMHILTLILMYLCSAHDYKTLLTLVLTIFCVLQVEALKIFIVM